MPDYDVGAVGLSYPPASAVIQAYRPAVSVRNNGVHDALAVGSLRIYSAGLLIFTTEIYSATIAPGETKPAQATDYWTPPALGRYQLIAYVSCINDQYEPNNNLAPCFVDVIPGEPTPPTPVALHAAQHEEGGGDELNIDGLHGRATDAQTPLAHKTSHQAGGADTLDVTGLLGTLGTPQPIADHHTTHENDGGDELNVDDLHGVLYNLQKPQVHANEAHDPNFSQDPHGASDHNSSVEATANKGVANGYPPLDELGVIPAAYLGEPVPPFGAPVAGTPGYTNSEGQEDLAARSDHLHAVSGQVRVNFTRGHITDGETVALAPYTVPINCNSGTLRMKAWGRISGGASGCTVALTLSADALSPGDPYISQIPVPIAPGDSDLPLTIEAEITMGDVYVDGWMKATLGTIHPHGTEAKVYLDTYGISYYPNRQALAMPCAIYCLVDGTDGDFYVHWDHVDLIRP